MIIIESLKNYINQNNYDIFFDLARKIYQLTNFTCEDYPNYKEWYFKKQLPGVTTNNRNIIFVRNPNNQSEIIAMASLKKDEEEKKICTLFVDEKYRKMGIGSFLIEESMRWLETNKPLITIPEHKLDMFASIIKKYDWELTDTINGLYNLKSKELCYNKSLVKK